MDNVEYEQFLNRTLNMIENVVNFIEKQGKHIVAYHKLLGIQQKLVTIPDKEKKQSMVDIMISIKFAIGDLMDGRYNEALSKIKIIRTKLYQRYGEVQEKNESH